MKRITNTLLSGILICCALASCTDFLALKPDKTLAVPSTSKDLMAMLDKVTEMNYNYAAGLGEIASDNVFLPFETWASISTPEYRLTYVWGKEPVDKLYWNPIYKKIAVCNTVIESIDKVTHENPRERDEILAIARFFRAYAFFDLLQVFSVPYDEDNADSQLGIALRLTADINVPSQRASVKDSYDRVLDDLKTAAVSLPSAGYQYPTRPSKAAAFAVLARVYLSMNNYDDAAKYADSCLQLYDNLLDFRNIDATQSYPFERFNEEVIFYAQASGLGVLMESRGRVDTSFYASYYENDLRKELFFKPASDGYYAFTGDYGQNVSVAKFSGVTTAEMLLTRAECLARIGDVQSALAALNRLLVARYIDEPSIPFDTTNSDLLDRILDERRKELVFRGIRWIDIRRLNNIGYSFELVRLLGDESYRLDSETIREFAFLIPNDVIERSDIPQN